MSMSDLWSIKPGNDGDWRWTRMASNGHVVGKSTEGYRNKDDCEANAVRNGLAPGPTHVHEDKWTVYKDAAGEWRWTRKAINGKIVGAAHEGYKNSSDCVANARRHGYPGA